MKNAQHPISNLDDLAESSYQVVVLNGSNTHESFKTSQLETHRNIWQRIRAGDTIVSNTSQAIARVREKGEVVLITDAPALQYAANQPPCDLAIGTDSLSQLHHLLVRMITIAGFHVTS